MGCTQGKTSEFVNSTTMYEIFAEMIKKKAAPEAADADKLAACKYRDLERPDNKPPLLYLARSKLPWFKCLIETKACPLDSTWTLEPGGTEFSMYKELVYHEAQKRLWDIAISRRQREAEKEKANTRGSTDLALHTGLKASPHWRCFIDSSLEHWALEGLQSVAALATIPFPIIGIPVAIFAAARTIRKSINTRSGLREITARVERIEHYAQAIIEERCHQALLSHQRKVESDAFDEARARAKKDILNIHLQEVRTVLMSGKNLQAKHKVIDGVLEKLVGMMDATSEEREKLRRDPPQDIEGTE